MELTGIQFLLFLCVVFLLYFTVFRKRQWVLLLAASIVFYVFAGVKYIVFIVISSLVTWLIGLKIQSLNDREKEIVSDKTLEKEIIKQHRAEFLKRRRFWMVLDLLINLGILCVIKYTNFALQEVSLLLEHFGIQWSKSFSFVLPLGISFYTFMLVSYILDLYWKRYRAETNFFRMLLFASYFPHITQGPLSRYNKLAPQLAQNHSFDYDRAAKGLQLMLWGFFEKLVIADRLAIFTNGVYSRWKSLNGLPLVVAIIFFSVRLYMDFQGCMDIGRGVSQVFGIELELNFNHPYFSKTMPEFWRRWHITLGAWFKEYLLYPVSMTPLCKNLTRVTRRKYGAAVSRVVSTIIPSICVWLVTGIWHGAAVRYIFWGFYHGILIIGSNILEIPAEKAVAAMKIRKDTFSYELFQMTRTFILSAIGRIFFFAANAVEARAIFFRMFNFRNPALYTLWDGSMYTYGLDQYAYYLAWLLIAMLWGIGMVQERGVVIRDWIGKQNLLFRWVLYLLLIASILILGVYGKGYDASKFVYGAF